MSEGTAEYDYDAAGLQVRLDDDDRSKNNATALSGYPLDVRPQEDWPGIEGGKAGSLRLEPEAARDVVAWLDGRWRELATVPGTLRSETSQVSFGPPTWLEANQLAAAHAQVSQAIDDFGTELTRNLAAAAEAIEIAVDRYVGADRTTGQRMQEVDSALGGGTGLGTSSPGGPAAPAAPGSGGVQSW